MFITICNFAIPGQSTYVLAKHFLFFGLDRDGGGSIPGIVDASPSTVPLPGLLSLTKQSLSLA